LALSVCGCAPLGALYRRSLAPRGKFRSVPPRGYVDELSNKGPITPDAIHVPKEPGGFSASYLKRRASRAPSIPLINRCASMCGRLSFIQSWC
jgi:hypothetical protein